MINCLEALLIFLAAALVIVFFIIAVSIIIYVLIELDVGKIIANKIKKKVRGGN